MQWMDWQTRKKSVIILNLCWNIQQLSLKELRKLSHPEQEMLTRWVSGNGPTDAPTDGCTWPPLYVKFIIRYMFIISITSTVDIWNCNNFFSFSSPRSLELALWQAPPKVLSWSSGPSQWGRREKRKRRVQESRVSLFPAGTVRLNLSLQQKGLVSSYITCFLRLICFKDIENRQVEKEKGKEEGNGGVKVMLCCKLWRSKLLHVWFLHDCYITCLLGHNSDHSITLDSDRRLKMLGNVNHK